MNDLLSYLVGNPAALAVVAVAVLALIGLTIRMLRRVSKLAVGAAVVQAGVTFAVITGTYEFCHAVFGMPWWEAAAMAVFLEAATWVTVGMVHAHGADPDAAGFGPAGPFFWIFSTLGGLLAVIAGDTHGEMVGRAIVVVFGACLWYLQLLRKTRRRDGSARRKGSTTVLWSPRRLLIWARVIAPGEHDEIGIDRTRRVRALTRCGHRAVEWRRLGGYYRTRLAALARTSDGAMLAEAAAQVALGREAFRFMVDEADAEASSEASAAASSDAPDEAGREAPDKASADTPDEASVDASVKRPTSKNAVRLAKLRERQPAITQADAIKRLKVSRPTVQRYWPYTAPASATPEPAPINGREVHA